MRCFYKSIATVAVLTVAAPVTANSTNSEGAEDTIVVTATLRPEAFQNVPASFVVLSGDRFAGANAFDGAEEVTQLLSGVQAAVANGTQVAFQIRGVGAVDHQALTPTAAAVYMDGVYLATNVQTGLFLYDVERAEILKGPQGTLYGRNASGGAIHFISARPSEDQTSYLSASYGRFDRIDVKGAVGESLSDTVSVRLAGRYLSQDPVLDNVQADPAFPRGPEDAGGVRDEFGVRGSLLWSAGEATDVLFRVHYEEDNGVNPAPRNLSLDVDDHDISVGGDGVQDTDNEFFGASVEATSQWRGWDVFSLTAVEGYNQQYGFDFDGSQAPFGDPTLNANLRYDRDFLQASQEVRLRKSWDRVDVLIGLMGAIEDFEQEYLIWCGELDPATLIGDCGYVGAPGRVGSPPASTSDVRSLITDIEQTRETAALFTHNDIELGGPLTLTLGARYTYENIEGSGAGRHIFEDGTIALNNRDDVGPAIGSNRIIENRLTGNVALRYALSETASAYVSYANGYKSGGFNGEVQNNATHFQDEGLFEAETVNAYEIGLKARPSDTLSFNAALFYQDYQDPQARIFVDFPQPDGSVITSNSLSNLDEAVSYGLEGDIAWSPVEGLDLAANLTLLETEIDQQGDVGGNAADFDGNPLPFASDVSIAAFARYERPVSDDVRMAIEANAKYQSEYYLDAEGLEERRDDGYTIVDASLKAYFDKPSLEVGVWGRNLLDEDYAVSGFGFIGYNTFIGAPRTYGVQVTLKR